MVHNSCCAETFGRLFVLGISVPLQAFLATSQMVAAQKLEVQVFVALIVVAQLLVLQKFLKSILAAPTKLVLTAQGVAAQSLVAKHPQISRQKSSDIEELDVQ